MTQVGAEVTTSPVRHPIGESPEVPDGAEDWSWLAPRADGGGWLAPIPEGGLPESVRARPTRIHQLSRTERALLACLRWWIAGAHAAVLARDCGISTDHAWSCLRTLTTEGYARSWSEPLYWGHGHRQIVCWGGDVSSPRWLDALPRLPVPVAPTAPERAAGLPPEFWKHFWSGTDPANIRLPDDGELVASVLIYDERCASAKSWALCNLDTASLRSTLEMRGLSEQARSATRASLQRRGASAAD
ncbi:MAG: hypothetical protein OXE75_14255 [bacterium]|nr:hypothetical protein [bacterium]